MRILLTWSCVLLLALVGCATDPPSDQPSDQPSAPPSGPPSGPRPEPSSAAAPTPARALVDLAVGGAAGDAVPWGDRVAYSVEGDVVRVLDPTTASSRRSWDACPRGTATLEGRRCPVNALGALAAADRGAGGVVEEQRAPRGVVGCVRYVDPTAGDPDDATTTSWLRPPEDARSCFDDLAVAVSVSSAGRVVAVDLALSSP